MQNFENLYEAVLRGDALVEAGIRQQVKVLVGGAPITQKFADEIGADGFSESAAGAVAAARTVLGR